MEWESYWDNLIEKKKLRPRLDELDELDKARCNPYTTEQICHKIYDDYYRIWRPKWKQVILRNVRIIYYDERPD